MPVKEVTFNIADLVTDLWNRLEKEAKRRNSAYDYFGSDNTPKSVDLQVYHAIIALKYFSEKFPELKNISYPDYHE